MRLNLTDLAVSQLKSETQLDVYDTQLKRFGVRVQKNTKTFFVFAGNPRRRIALGKYPDTTLKAARKAAQRHLSNPANPLVARTFKEAKTAYISTYIEANYRSRTIYSTKRLFALSDKLDGKDLNEITAAHLTELFQTLAPSQANHLYGVLKTFFNWCIGRNYVTTSPIAKLAKPHKEKSRKRVLSDHELATLFKAAPKTEFGTILKLLIMSGQRRGEIAPDKEPTVTEDGITFHDTKNGEDHTIPLTQGIKRLLEDHEWKPYYNFGKAKNELAETVGFSDWTLHDLRRTFSTKLAELGIAPHIIEALLNHQSGTITPIARTYNRYKYFKEMREALELYDAYISRLILDRTNP